MLYFESKLESGVTFVRETELDEYGVTLEGVSEFEFGVTLDSEFDYERL